MQRFAPRIVSRFSRTGNPGPILAGLEDDDPEVATVVAVGLGLGGNPDAIASLKKTVANRAGEPRAAAERALAALGAD